MIKKEKELNRNKKPSILFTEGDNVSCIDVVGLPEEVAAWIFLKDVHKVRKVFSKSTEPILILEDIEGVASPKLNGRDYSFLGERFVKR